MVILPKLLPQDIELKKQKCQPGNYRSIMGNQALAYGLIAASQKSGLQLFLGSYPITPASDIIT